MRKFFALTAMLLMTLMAIAADRLVGGDLSLVPAYEQAGDQWLDESGKVIPDLILYVKEKGWNAVRVRLFVDPSQDASPTVCQDLPYVVELGKRVKAAGMNLLLDFHYSDTWADPGVQKIPAAWTDHSDAALVEKIGAYTSEAIQTLAAAGAMPDYVQIGNEITYGLLWNTADGKFPTDAAKYAQAGYCPTWSGKYADGEAQWKRTAALLGSAAKAVRAEAPKAKIVVHVTGVGEDVAKVGYYFKHLATAGFTDYDVVGLSYYPFWSGKLDALGAMLTRLKSDLPGKRVQIVETAWYNSYYPYTEDAKQEYTIASLDARWTADAQGMCNYLLDLTAKLKFYDNVDGLYYWQPEECGNGYEKKVMRNYTNRGLWRNSSQKQHALLRAPDGTNPVAALAQYLKESTPEEREDASEYFQNLGFETGNLDGWNIEQSYSTQKAGDIRSWASSDVVRGTYCLELWNSKIPGGTIMNQMANLPNGRYQVAVRARANSTGFYLYAGDAKTLIKGEIAAQWAATTNVKNGKLEFGLGAKESKEGNYAYFDDFTVTRIGDATNEADIDDTETDEPVQPAVNEYTDEQKVVYTLYPESMTAAVKNGKECMDTVYIPSTITVDEQTYRVNSIAGSAFNKNETINYVKIGRSINAIWGSAFSGCWYLHTVEFEEGSELKTIDGWAFHNTALDSIDVPVGVTEIAEGAFGHCWNLEKIVLRGEVTRIGAFAFSSWSADDAEFADPSGSPLSQGVWIYAVEAPEIDPKAFCPEDISDDTLYVHYTLLENEAYKALGFKEILPLDASDGSVAYTDAQGVRYKLWPEDGTASVVGYDKEHAPELVTDWQISIPETIVAEVDEEEMEFEVTRVAASAFSDHWTLTGIKLPEGLLEIGAWAFYKTGLSSIVVYDGVSEIAEGTFSKCWKLGNVEYLGDLTRIGDFAFSGWAEDGCASSGNQLQRVVLWSTSVPEISEKAFFADDIKDGTLYVDKALVDETGYTALGFKAVLPIDPAGISTVNSGAADSPCYDLTGRRVSTLRRGIYIRNGRKVVK